MPSMRAYVILLSLFFGGFELHAFTLTTSTGVKLPDPNVKVVIAGNNCDAAGFNSANALAEMVKESVDEYWNRISTCALELEVTGADSGVNTSSDTLIEALEKTPLGTILVGCSDNAALFASSSTLGVGSINTVSGDRGVLLLNNRDTTFANLEAQEKLAVIAHELGHAFGLGHSSQAAALMYFSVGGKVQKKLSIDDYDACTYLYPKDAPGGCGTVAFVDDGNSSGASGGLLTLFFGLGLMLISARLKSWKSFY